MYVNIKIISVVTIPGMGGEEWIKENDGGGEFKYEIFDIYDKNFCKCHNVPPFSTTMKKMICMVHLWQLNISIMISKEYDAE
jgi:hypothetical protein